MSCHRVIGLSINIEDFLLSARFPRDFRGLLADAQGELLSPAAAMAHMQARLAAGDKLIAASAHCGDPCPQEAAGCFGFDPLVGCPGYRSDSPRSAEAA